MWTSRLSVKQIVNSSLWITVLVVRVGCIIEAYPSPSNSNGHKLSHYPLNEQDGEQAELETAASHSFLSSPRNGLLGGGLSDSIISPRKQSSTSFHHQQRTNDDDRKVGYIPKGPSPILETTTHPTSSLSSRPNHNQNDDFKTSTLPNENIEDTDTCTGKADGYFQNFGSGCTSYYYCAAGYQITYVCPPGSKFNGKRCDGDYKCPTTTSDGHHISNLCENKQNGYYPSATVGKYFYCFQQAKVIELQCDSGKIFMRNKCVLQDTESKAITRENENTNGETDHDQEVDNDSTCARKRNGFYQDLTSNCRTYYYCIGEEKHELMCQHDYVFNGDICVHQARYQCPAKEDHSIDKENGSHSDLGELPITSGEEGMVIEDKISTTSTMDPSHLLNVS